MVVLTLLKIALLCIKQKLSSQQVLVIQWLTSALTLLGTGVQLLIVTFSLADILFAV